MRHRDRGIVGLGLGGSEAEFPPEPFERAFALARDGGLASVPHAGEAAGATSVRGALEALGAARIRHGETTRARLVAAAHTTGWNSTRA